MFYDIYDRYILWLLSSKILSVLNLHPVAYLGFKGVGDVRWPLKLTQRGKPRYPIHSVARDNITYVHYNTTAVFLERLTKSSLTNGLWDYNESCRCFGTFELNIPKNS